ncbi:MAG: hypothetical protein FJ222_06780 [Lentisphaerae bacterium]|nr:hypothetical protein [Lentisphaerota bacterium]
MRDFLIVAGISACGLACVASVVEAPREMTVLQEVDVLVLGGGSGAVQAAQKAAASGASVFLAAPARIWATISRARCVCYGRRMRSRRQRCAGRFMGPERSRLSARSIR